MKNNPAFQKSGHFLIHPYTLLALILYAVNEFVLQPYYPSWLSGKLSGFTWLFVAPVAAAFVLSLLIPVRWKNQTQWVRALAFGLAALFFIGLKTQAPFRDLVLEGWLAMLNFPATVNLDPTDLLALLILPLSWRIWSKSSSITSRPFTLRAAWVLPVFALLTLADAPAPISGVNDLAIQQDQIVAKTNFEGNYCSKDNGFSWQDCYYDSENPTAFEDYQIDNEIIIPNTKVQYHITESGMVRVSHDAGLNWKGLYGRLNFSDVQEYFQAQNRPNAVISKTGARDAVYDSTSGNVIFAMGLQGVIVVTPNGLPHHIGVGENQPVNLSNPLVFMSLMLPYMLLAVGVIILFLGTILLFSKGFFYWLLLLVSLGSWGLLAYDFNNLGYGLVVILGMTIVAISIVSVFVGNELVKIKKEDKQQLHMRIRLSLTGGVSYLLCYFLWYINIIHKHLWAVYFSFVIIFIWFVLCVFQSYKLKVKLQEQNESS